MPKDLSICRNIWSRTAGVGCWGWSRRHSAAETPPKWKVCWEQSAWLSSRWSWPKMTRGPETGCRTYGGSSDEPMLCSLSDFEWKNINFYFVLALDFECLVILTRNGIILHSTIPYRNIKVSDGSHFVIIFLDESPFVKVAPQSVDDEEQEGNYQHPDHNVHRRLGTYVIHYIPYPITHLLYISFILLTYRHVGLPCPLLVLTQQPHHRWISRLQHLCALLQQLPPLPLLNLVLAWTLPMEYPTHISVSLSRSHRPALPVQILQLYSILATIGWLRFPVKTTTDEFVLAGDTGVSDIL